MTLVPSTRPYLSKVLPFPQRLLTKSFIHSSGGQFKIQTVKDSAVTSPDRLSCQRNEAFLLFVKSPKHIFILIQPTKPSSTSNGLENTDSIHLYFWSPSISELSCQRLLPKPAMLWDTTVPGGAASGPDTAPTHRQIKLFYFLSAVAILCTPLLHYWESFVCHSWLLNWFF